MPSGGIFGNASKCELDCILWFSAAEGMVISPADAPESIVIASRTTSGSSETGGMR